MKLKLVRENLTDGYTEGKLYIDDKFFSYTLEDKVRDSNHDGDLNDLGEGKIKHRTAIPYGNYKVFLTYSPTFKTMLPLITGVKHFSGIRIHWGNTADNSSGCILIGEAKSAGKIYRTRITINKLIEKMKGSKQESWELEIV